jgi:hypothetical protein
VDKWFLTAVVAKSVIAISWYLDKALSFDYFYILCLKVKGKIILNVAL